MNDPKLIQFINRGEMLLLRLKALTRKMEGRLYRALDRRSGRDRRVVNLRREGDRRVGERRAASA